MLRSMEASFPSVGATVESTHQGVNWVMIVGVLVSFSFWGAVAFGIVAAV